MKNHTMITAVKRLVKSVFAVSACAALLHSVTAWSQIPTGVVDFANAEEIKKQVSSTKRKQLILGQLKRIRGVMEAERSMAVNAKSVTRTVKIPEGPKTDVVYEHYVKQLKVNSYKTLYQCQGRDCGPANDWANQVFNEAQLYGPDRYQHYSVSQLSDTRLLLLYVSQRGTRDVMVHYEAWETSEPLELVVDPREEFLDSLTSNGQAWLGGWVINQDELNLISSRPSLEILASGIRQHPEKNIAVMVHLPDADQPSTLFKKSDAVANQLDGYFKSRGLSIFVKSMGPIESELKHEYGGKAVEPGNIIVEVVLF